MHTYRIMLLVTVMVTAARAGDRVYTADQTSNTVSVIDPATNKLLGSIHLGEDVPAALSPLYRGELLVHGLGFSSALVLFLRCLPLQLRCGLMRLISSSTAFIPFWAAAEGPAARKRVGNPTD